MKCQRRRSDGEPCRAQAIDGLPACRVHSGMPLAKAKAKGAVAVEVRRWNLDDIPEDPGLLLLKLMSVTEWTRQAYEAEIDRILAAADVPLSEALVGDSIVVDKDGSPHKVGEYVRGIVELEAAERERAAGMAVKVLAAGVQERLTRVQEQTGQLVAQVIRAVLTQLGHDLADPEVLRIVATNLKALGGAA